MIIICINNKNYERYLTLNKKYETITINIHGCYHLISDTGIYISTNYERFITIQEYREKQLNLLF